MNCKICAKELAGKQIKYCSKSCKSRDSDNQKNSYSKQQERARKRKLEAINLKGGGCNVCGYNKNYSALVFHHLEPSQKDFGLDSRKFSNKSIDKIKEELAKCILLCSNCHHEFHNPDCIINR